MRHGAAFFLLPIKQKTPNQKSNFDPLLTTTDANFTRLQQDSAFSRQSKHILLPASTLLQVTRSANAPVAGLPFENEYMEPNAP